MLRVHGVESEDLRALYHKLCFNLQLTPPPKVSDIFRARKSQQTHVDPVIIIKMLNPREKIKLLGQVGMYRCEHKKQLSLQFLGFNSEAIIYIYEQLLKECYLIFKEAMRMKKRKVLTAVFTRCGFAHVRCTRREGALCINSMEELSSINYSPYPLSTSLTNASAGHEAGSFRS